MYVETEYVTIGNDARKLSINRPNEGAMREKKNLTEADAEFILKHKPDPTKMTVSQLAEMFETTQGIIYGIWDRRGLAQASYSKRKKDLSPEDIMDIEKYLETEMKDTEIADQLEIVTRLVRKHRKKHLKARRTKIGFG